MDSSIYQKKIDALGAQTQEPIKCKSFFFKVSIVNLVMTVGISTQFCFHLLHAFNHSVGKNNVERALESLILVAPSVFSGESYT